MCKFIRIVSYSVFEQDKTNAGYISCIEKLYRKYCNNLSDDFCPYKNTDISDFITSLTPYFWVITNQNDRFMGFAYLDDFVGSKDVFYSAEVSVCFAKHAWGNFVRYCAKFFFKMCFDVFRFYKIKAQIYPQNFYAKQLMKDCGFKFESLLLSETLRQGKPQNIEVYSLYRNYYYK